jgi:hypothetical protein
METTKQIKISSVEKVNINNLLALCNSKKLKEWDAGNFPPVKQGKKEIEFNDEEQEKTIDGKPEFVRHHINSIRKYAELAIPNNGEIEILYCGDDFGRLKNLNAYNKCYSFTNMYGEIRNLLAHDLYLDFDMKNAHFVFFFNELIKNNIDDYKYLKEYIEKRELIFKEIIETNADAISKETKEKFLILDEDQTKKILKQIFTSILNNASLNKIKLEYNLNNKLDFINNLYNELQRNIKKIIDLEEYNELKKQVIKRKQKENNTENIDGAIISTIMQTKEREALLKFKEVVEKDKFIVGSLIHDGLHIEKSSREITKEIIKNWEDSINTYLYKDLKNIKPVEIVNKPMKIDESFLIPDDETLKYNYHKSLLEKKKGIAKIITPFCYMSYIDEKIELMTEEQLQGIYKNYIFQMKNKPFINYWMSDPTMKTYDKIEFNPKNNSPKNIFNTFTGFEIDKYKFDDLPTTQEEREKEIKPILNFMYDISGRDAKQHETFMNYTSSIISKPYKKVKISVIMKGQQQGVGQNTYFLIMKKMLGDKYCVSTPDIDSVFGKFSNVRQDKLFICLNEASFADTKKYQGKLKDAITEPDYILELKNINKTTYNSFENYILYSNEFNPLEIEAENRRFFVIDLDIVKYENKKDIFNYIYKNFLGDEDHPTNWRNLKIFYEYMKQYYIDNNVDKYNFEENIKTKESEILKNADPLREFIEIFCIRKLQDDNNLINIEEPTKNLFDEYILYLRGLRMKTENLNVLSFSKLILSKFKNFIETARDSKTRKYIINVNNFLEYFNINKDSINNINLD